MLSMRSFPAADEAGGEQAHEAGEADDLDAVLFQRRLQGALEGCAVLSESGVIDDLGGYSIGPCDHEAARIRTI